jgi:TatD DNase family protein
VIMKFFDTHAHVNFSAFREDGEKILKKCLAEGVFVVNVGSQFSTSQRAVDYAHKFENGIWAAVGIHPVHLNEKTIHLDPDEVSIASDIKTRSEDFSEKEYKKLAQDEKVLAIGEVGLDYHHFEKADDTKFLKEKQKEVLIKFINLANDVNKPVILHCWDAYEDLLEILKNNSVNKKGILHSFIGGYKTANKFIELGYKIGLNGIITYSKDFERLLREISLENIVIETDCPYLAPAPHKGERNEPLYVKLVAEKIAQIKEISTEEVARATSENAKKVFNL